MEPSGDIVQPNNDSLKKGQKSLKCLLNILAQMPFIYFGART